MFALRCDCMNISIKVLVCKLNAVFPRSVWFTLIAVVKAWIHNKYRKQNWDCIQSLLIFLDILSLKFTLKVMNEIEQLRIQPNKKKYKINMKINLFWSTYVSKAWSTTTFNTYKYTCKVLHYKYGSQSKHSLVALFITSQSLLFFWIAIGIESVEVRSLTVAMEKGS